MNTVADFGIQNIYHITPIHYLVFIARNKSLLSKVELSKTGFSDSHFRSKSKMQDVERGFESYAHLTTSEFPPILRAKLSAGFPHVALEIPSQLLDGVDFDLCRYNVAMTRRLRRGNHFGHKESPMNGRYYDDIQIPIARTCEDQASLLTQNILQGNMIEILVPSVLNLAQPINIVTFNEDDFNLIQRILAELDCEWLIANNQVKNYIPNPKYFAVCENFLARALDQSSWRGDGLEFDKV